MRCIFEKRLMEEFANDIARHLTHYYEAIVRVTPKLILAVIAFLVALFIASKAKSIAGRSLQKRMHDPLLANFIARFIKAVFVIVGLLLVLRIVGLTGIAATLLAGAGISAFVIGFALKDIGENFLAGILLAFKRPFHIGDTIESNGVKGKVLALNLRDTQVLSDGKNIFMPNALLIKNPLTNFTKEKILPQEVVIGVEYGADYEKAISIISDTVSKIEGVLSGEHPHSVLVTGFSINSVQITVQYWIDAHGPGSGKIKSQAIIGIMNALRDAGFNIPTNVVEIKKYEPDVYREEERPGIDGKRAIGNP